MNRSSIRRAAAGTGGGVFLAAAVLLFALASTGCGGRYRVDTQISDDGTTTYTLANNEIVVEGGTKYYGGLDERDRRIEKQCFLDLRAREKPGAGRTFELVLTYVGLKGLNIMPGRSLELVVDANSSVLSAVGGVRQSRDPSGTLVTESLDYPVSSKLLLRMAEATTIRVIVSGQDGEVTGAFYETNFANLRRFVDDYVQ
jgi:hypothetical protein